LGRCRDEARREIHVTPLDDELALLDASLDSYVGWRAACDDVWSAYRAWLECDSAEGGLRFAAYQSALDREEYTAVIHHRRLSMLALERLRAVQAGARSG
jgi:hypothetical protein